MVTAFIIQEYPAAMQETNREQDVTEFQRGAKSEERSAVSEQQNRPMGGLFILFSF